VTTPHRCWSCGGTNTTYAVFSGGREYYCEDCDDKFPYEEGTAPRRVQMIADGKFAELREEMHEHLDRHKDPSCQCWPGYAVCDSCRAKYYPPVSQGE